VNKKPRFSYGERVLLNLSCRCWGFAKGACPLWVRVVKKSKTFQISVAPENRICSEISFGKFPPLLIVILKAIDLVKLIASILYVHTLGTHTRHTCGTQKAQKFTIFVPDV